MLLVVLLHRSVCKQLNRFEKFKHRINYLIAVLHLNFKGQYPWVAALGYRFPNASANGIQFYCAGSLITRSHIVSSAHCLNTYLRIVRLGQYDLSAQSYRSDFAIEWTKVHENYVPDIILNDIGIIKLRRQAPINGEN